MWVLVVFKFASPSRQTVLNETVSVLLFRVR